MDAAGFDACAVHGEIALLLGKPFGVGKNPCCGLAEIHQMSSLCEKGMAVEMVRTAEIVDAARKGDGLFQVLDHLPHVCDAAVFVRGHLDSRPLIVGLAQVDQDVAVQLHLALG